jgi:sRNA-binding regulator protein Hfq
MVNRKLIRPNLAEIKNKLAPKPVIHDAPPMAAREGGNLHPRRRVAPPDQTSAEAFYYLKQMNSKTPMVLVLTDGTELRGHIEWYDRSCLKVHRAKEPNVLIYKHSIRMLYKEEDEFSRDA